MASRTERALAFARRRWREARKVMAEPDQQVKRAAAAAGIVGAAGAAVVAGRAGIEALRDSGRDGDGDGPSRAYRLEKGEPLGEGLLRIARGRVDEALDQLRGTNGD